MSGIRHALEGVDGLFLDVWGVIFDGEGLIPGAADALEHLVRSSIPVVLLSNASYRADHLVMVLAQAGLARELYNAVVTSGEETRVLLAERRESLGARVLFVGSEVNRALLCGLPFECTSEPDDADFVLLADPDPTRAAAMVVAAKRGLPLVCANPDRNFPSAEGTLVPCAGEEAIDWPGEVLAVGKPWPRIYRAAQKHLGGRILAVGDTIETDLLGAKAAGLPAVFVNSRGESQETLTRAFAVHGVSPRAVLQSFRW